jgi:hypothetical protein
LENVFDSFWVLSLLFIHFFFSFGERPVFFQIGLNESKKLFQKGDWDDLWQVVGPMIDFKRVKGQEPDKKLEELADVLSSRLRDFILIAFLNNFRLRSKWHYMFVSIFEKFLQERKQF